ncbi:ATP-binding protein [Stenotrophomonas rhizophila]|uniref:ATP-binding protein n=1 Tax=Stenotrophomonas rhizophila TaxID=216778 RepID=UPI00339A1E53
MFATAGTLLWLALWPSKAQRVPYHLAIGPQLASQHGLSGDPENGGASAYLEAVQALSGLKLELVRAPSIERAAALLKDQQVDGLAFSLPSTASLLPSSVALSPSFYSGSTVMVTRRTAAPRALWSMSGMRVGVIGNGEYRAFLAENFPDIDIYQMANGDEMLDAVDRGAIDAALGVDAVLAPLTRKRFDERLAVQVVPDAPAVEMRVASLPHRAGEMEMAHQTFRSLPLDTRQDILERWLNALYRSPPTLHAVLSHYRLQITLLCAVLLTILLAVTQTQRKARALAARQASAAKILTLVNHEMRNGAASVISAIDLLESEANARERERLLRSARSAADALKHTLTNALEFMFRNTPEQADATFVKNAHEVVEECLSAMRPLAHCKGLRLVLRAEGADDAQALCDARALHHIASNLISNAIKFSNHGEVAIELCFLAGVGQVGTIRLSVTDVGPGIAPEDLANIFEPFSAARIGRLNHGAGIGLSLCRRIARAHGGDVTVSSQPGLGATFVALLRAQRGTDELAIDPRNAPAEAPSVARALVIEDQPAIARIMVRRLCGLGLDALIASSGAAAIRTLKQHGPFGIITVDGDLLDADGSDVALEIRAIERGRDWPPARMLSISASPEAIDRAAYARAGVEMYLGKPIDWRAFEAATGCPAPSARAAPAPVEEGLSMMEIYHQQMRIDRTALEVSLRVQNWRGALAMAHRMRGAASMVADVEAVTALCELQQRLKVHAINGNPADAGIWALVASIGREETDSAEKQSS